MCSRRLKSLGDLRQVHPSLKVRTARSENSAVHPSVLEPTRSDSAFTHLPDDVRTRVEENLGLVHHIVARVRGRLPAHHETDDLFQAGSLGLIDAAGRFDPDRGIRFSTFAGRRIEGAIADHLRSEDWAPRSVRRFERHLAEIDGRPQTDPGVSRAELDRRRALVDRARVESIHDQQAEAAASGPLPGERLDRLDDLEAVRAALERLRPKERFVVEAHFLDGRSITEIGESLGVTQSRASQLKAEALRSLRATLRDALL